jgi:glycosyltransferase involved in cell wall biosynthesis
MSAVTISVIIPTHRRRELLTGALASVSAQEHAPLEVLVVDDVPEESTRAAVEAAAASCSYPIRYLVNAEPRRGAITSRNLAAAQARGEVLAFLDDDDLWERSYLASVVDRFTDGVPTVCLAPIRSVDHHTLEPIAPDTHPPTSYDRTDFLVANAGALCSNLAVSAIAFRQVGGFDPSVHGSADKDLFMRLLEAQVRYVRLPSPPVLWRTHPHQWSADPWAVLRSNVPFTRKWWRRAPRYIRSYMLRRLARLAWQGLLLRLRRLMSRGGDGKAR